MASIHIPITELKQDSLLGASIGASTVPLGLRKILVFYVFPRTLEMLNKTLSGENLGRLTREQAVELYAPVAAFHQTISEFVTGFGSRSWLERTLFGWWLKKIHEQNDDLGDIVESLAWGSDDDLRMVINSAVDAVKIERAEGHLHRA